MLRYYKLVRSEKPGYCFGCIFHTDGGDCRMPRYLKSCIDPSKDEESLRFKVYIAIPELNSNVKIL